MRYLGIDFGTKKLGLALSDEAGVMGFPHSIIPNTGHLVEELSALIAKEGVEEVVIGESKMLSGEENPVAQKARELAKELTRLSGVPVSFEPEMFTTQEARRDMEGLRTITGDVDSSAAALILTSFLDKKNSALHHD
jgi:putative Holliday junction resolvase